MNSGCRKEKSSRPFEARLSAPFGFFVLILVCVLLTSCNEIGTPKSEPLIAETSPPAKQEFRWTNGKMPESFDPAFASAPPETDLVRALFEGLTDIDARTLREVPGVAERWTASDDLKTWTFYLRPDAKWSNGKPVTAEDFVRSWTRLAKLGRQVPHHDILRNIQGVRELNAARPGPAAAKPDFLSQSDPSETGGAFPAGSPGNGNTATPAPAAPLGTQRQPSPPANKTDNGLPPSSDISTLQGVVAQSELVLRVQLVFPDRDFAKLVASPIFRPTFGEIPAPMGDVRSSEVITNGAFRVSSVEPEGITLIRSDNYWDKKSVELERVRFIPQGDAEKALEAYRSGEVDAVTNADFEPLALKLLSPFDDFRQTTHSAVNVYAINFKKEPFSDRRIRQALAMAIEREVLTEGELESSTRPALSFLPFGQQPSVKLEEDRNTARQLMEDAGFPDGLNFPKVRLVINRNDIQQRIARLVARMWKRNLNIETEIVVKGPNDIEAAEAGGEYDIIRRGVVFPSNDEAMSLISIFGEGEELVTPAAGDEREPGSTQSDGNGEHQQPKVGNDAEVGTEKSGYPTILTEDEAISQLRAIPLYFPTSYSLVKPYVTGFEMNGLDAPSLKDVSIDNAWQPK